MATCNIRVNFIGNADACPTCQQPRQPWTRMPAPLEPGELPDIKAQIGNVLILHGWITYDGITWRHRQEPRETFSIGTALVRELFKLRSGLRRVPTTLTPSLEAGLAELLERERNGG